MGVKEKVKIAKYFSSDINRSIVVMSLIKHNGIVDNIEIGKILINNVTDKDYGILSSVDLSELSNILTLYKKDSFNCLNISNNFLKQCIKNLVLDNNFSCMAYFYVNIDKEHDGDGNSNIEKSH